MPAHEHLLIPEKIRLLAAFVYSLSQNNATQGNTIQEGKTSNMNP
jgi:hypothetical protein